jgi:hypothetical protein
MTEPTTLSIIVESDQEVGDQPPPTAEDFEPQALPLPWKRKQAKDIDLKGLKESADRVQREVAELLSGMEARTIRGWHLSTVEVGVAITAEGSIGVVTAGVEASLTLAFEKHTDSAAAASE